MLWSADERSFRNFLDRSVERPDCFALLLFFNEGINAPIFHRRRGGCHKHRRRSIVSPTDRTTTPKWLCGTKEKMCHYYKLPSVDRNPSLLCVTDMYKSAFFFKWWIMGGGLALTHARKETKKKIQGRRWKKIKDKSVKRGRKDNRKKKLKKISPVFLQSANIFS